MSVLQDLRVLSLPSTGTTQKKTSPSQENSYYKPRCESFPLSANLACRATQFIRGYGKECGGSPIAGNPFAQSSTPLDTTQKCGTC